MWFKLLEIVVSFAVYYHQTSLSDRYLNNPRKSLVPIGHPQTKPDPDIYAFRTVSGFKTASGAILMSGNIFTSVKRDRKAEKAFTDRVGGYTPVDGDAYPFIIKRVYAVSSQSSDSKGVVIEATLTMPDDSERNYSETLWVTDKEGKATKTNRRTGKVEPNANWINVNDLASLATDGEKDFTQLEYEDFNYKATVDGKEKTITTQSFYELEGFEGVVAIRRYQRWKQEKNAKGDYEDTDEAVDVNAIDRFFDINYFTDRELAEELKEPVFIDKWLERNQGKVPAPYGSPRKSSGSSSSSDRRTTGRTGAKSRFDD